MGTFTAPESFQLQYLTEGLGLALRRFELSKIRCRERILHEVVDDLNFLGQPASLKNYG